MRRVEQKAPGISAGRVLLTLFTGAAIALSVAAHPWTAPSAGDSPRLGAPPNIQ